MLFKLSSILFFGLILFSSSCCNKNRCEDFKPTGLDIRLENNFIDDSTFVVLYEDTTFTDTVKMITIPSIGLVMETDYMPWPLFSIHTRNNTQVDTITFLHMIAFDESIGCKKCPMQFDSPSPDSYHDGTWSGFLNGVPFDEKVILVIP